MQKLKIAGTVLAFTLAVVSCNRDEELTPTPSKGSYEHGILVASEGNFSRPNAEVGFIDNDLSKIDNDLYKKINRENLGDVLQNLNFHNDDAYFVMNNSNRVVIANRYTLQKKAVIEKEVNQPRYITFSGDYAYLTNSATQSVGVYSTKDYSFVKKIDINKTCERILSVKNNIFVQNASFGFGSSLTLISTGNNEVKNTIKIPKGHIDKTISYNDYVYVIAGSAEDVDSYIYQYNADGTLVKTITLTGISKAKNLDIDKGRFYFTSGTGVYTMALDGKTIPKHPFINVTNNSWSTFYGFNVIDGFVYVSDAKGFTESSEISVYTTTGKLVKIFKGGMGVNAFYKN